ncbi:unnamed protein product [Staurois parvus]|uniref:Secreted protein n=1 Tax=Staurois parvus TaxID=386267 RepID=A0ABN9CC04_9NEOB|nr:unnamed protein product [Staurois parvus]
MGPRTAWSRCCWSHSVTWVPVRPPIASTLPCATLRSPHTPAVFHFVLGPCTASHCSHSAMCHFEVSSHCWCVQFFDIGCWQITGLPLLLPGT